MKPLTYWSALLLFYNQITQQLYGDMTLEKYGSVWEIDYCFPISSFNLLDENEIKKSSSWIKLRPLCGNKNVSKQAKTDHFIHLLQESKTKHFLNIYDEEG